MKQWNEFRKGLSFPVFDKETEQRYVLDYNKKSLFFLRLSLIGISIIAIVIFTLLDNYTMPLHKEEIRNIHFFIQAPVLLLAIYLSY